MTKLRERTSCLRKEWGEFQGSCENWKWIDVKETPEGGARVVMGKPEDNLEILEKLDCELREMGIMAEMELNPAGSGFVLVNEEGKQVSFEMVMKALFD